MPEEIFGPIEEIRKKGDNIVLSSSCGPWSNRKKVELFRDGDKWCAVEPGFIDLQQSDAGFGDTAGEAVDALFVDSECPQCLDTGVIHDGTQNMQLCRACTAARRQGLEGAK